MKRMEHMIGFINTTTIQKQANGIQLKQYAEISNGLCSI